MRVQAPHRALVDADLGERRGRPHGVLRLEAQVGRASAVPSVGEGESGAAIALDRWTLRRIKMGDFEPEIDDKIFDDGRLLMPGQYLVIWAYREVDAGPPGLNAGFKLSKFGMVRLMLMDPEGAVVDEVEYPEILDGASYARQSISAEDWQIVEADLVTRGRPNAAAAP